MGKLLFTEDGGQIWRNFSDYRVMYADGTISRRREFAGTIILSTGKGEIRTLEFHLPDARPSFRSRADVQAFAAGILVMQLLNILVGIVARF